MKVLDDIRTWKANRKADKEKVAAKKEKEDSFFKDIETYKSLLVDDKFCIDEQYLYPILSDKDANAGSVDIHYYLQDIYMAQQIIKSGVYEHYDIGSRVDGFISHLLCSEQIKNVVLLDIRPLPVKIDKLSFIQADAVSLSTIDDESISSLSSLHAIEHFGLGRYGDIIDPYGWKKALHAMQNKVRQGGMLYISVPIGTTERVCFNAHRIFNPTTIIETIDRCELQSFAYVHDYKIIHESTDEFMINGGEYDCGLFVFRKK